jgi:hypothetical protein
VKRWGWILSVALLSACTAVVSAEAPVPESADEQPAVDEQPMVDEQPVVEDAVEPEAAEPVEVESEDPPAQQAAPLPDLGVAPELQNEVWLNVDAPLRLADLRGQVVLLDMWTFG